MLRLYVSPQTYYVGVDLDLNALERGKDLEARIVSDFVLADISDLPIRNSSFPAATLLEVLEHLSTPGKALAEVFRVLERRQTLILSTPNSQRLTEILGRLFKRKQKFISLDHLREYAPDELKKSLLEKGFRVTSVTSIRVQLPKHFPKTLEKFLNFQDVLAKFLSKPVLLGTFLLVLATKS